MADIFDAGLETEPLAKYLEIFALKCKRSNELWLFETQLLLKYGLHCNDPAYPYQIGPYHLAMF